MYVFKSFQILLSNFNKYAVHIQGMLVVVIIPRYIVVMYSPMVCILRTYFYLFTVSSLCM